MAVTAKNMMKVFEEQKPSLRDGKLGMIACFTEKEIQEQGSYKDLFSIHAENQAHYPKFVFVPKTKEGLCEIVKWAKKEGFRVQTSVYQKAKNNIGEDKGYILISLINPNHVETYTSLAKKPKDAESDFNINSIKFIKVPTNGEIEMLCKVGGAVTREQLSSFSRYHGDICEIRYGTPFYIPSAGIPSNSILVENTIAGIISSISHEAEIRGVPLSELIAEIEFINPNGCLQTISDPKLLEVVAGSFGLLGVMTAITLKLKKNNNIKTSNLETLPLATTIPPQKEMIKKMHINLLRNMLGLYYDDDPLGMENKGIHLFSPIEQLRDQVEKLVSDFTRDRYVNSTARFGNYCDNRYYAEWSWVVFNDRCSVQTWASPGFFTGEILRDFYEIIPKFDDTVRILHPDFREDLAKLDWDNAVRLGGSKRSDTREMEFEIPILLNKHGKPDWNICRRAWWDSIIFIYDTVEQTQKIPLNLILEMRIKGGSRMRMATEAEKQYTCVMNVVSSMAVPKEAWEEAIQQLITQWRSYKDEFGKSIYIRPFWSKHWDVLRISNQSMASYLRDICSKDTFASLKEKFRQIGQNAPGGNYDLEDVQKNFPNDLFNEIIQDKKPRTAMVFSQKLLGTPGVTNGSNNAQAYPNSTKPLIKSKL